MGSKWTEKEENFIKENWREKSDRELSKKLDRSINAIRNRRQKLDIRRPESHSGKFNQGIEWTKEKKEFLKENYEDMAYKEIANQLNTSTQAIKDKAARLNLEKQRRLSEDEIEFIKRHHVAESDYTIKKIAKELNLTFNQVSNAIKRYNLSYVNQEDFKDKEIKHLKHHYSEKTVDELADDLDRSWGSVMQKIQQLGLEKTPTWSNEELNFIEDNWRELSDSVIADKLDRSKLMVGRKRREMNLKYDTFVDTKNHWKWEKLCEKVASSLYGSVETQKVFQNNLRPDIYVEDKNLVIDAKLSVYSGAIEDVKKYYNLEDVNEVFIWSFRSYKPYSKDVSILDKNDLKNQLNDKNLVEKLDSFQLQNESPIIDQFSLEEFLV